MNKLSWYYQQPVTEDDVNFAFDSAEDAMRDLARYSQAPFGVVGGYDIAPDAGLSVQVGTVSGVMLVIDKQGRAIRPTAYPWVQSIATTTEGAASTAVSGAGNERWVSLYVRGGRSFVDAATDGFGNTVRKTALETVNNLGEVDHPAGAYDAGTALAAGVNLLYVAVGTEAPLGTAPRPALTDYSFLDGAILVADIRLVQGQSSIATSDIFIDRRERLVPDSVRVDTNERDRYFGDTVVKDGVISLSAISAHPSLPFLRVTSGRGYVQAASSLSPDHAYKRYDLGTGIEHLVPLVPPAGSSRIDLLVVDANGALSIVPGTPSADPVPPSVPSYTIALAQLLARVGTTVATTWPITRRSHRRLPYPYSTAHGILEGCRLQWRTLNPLDPVLKSQQTYLVSKKNKVVFNGEVVEFPGLLDGAGNPLLRGYPDINNSPYVADHPYSAPYYFYACKSVYWEPTNPYLAGTSASPVTIIESLTTPIHPQGFPSGPLRGPGGVIQPEDAFLIGVGWTEGGGGLPSRKAAPVRVTNDDWFYLHSSWNNTISIAAEAAVATHTFRSVPQTGHAAAVKVEVGAIVVASPTSAASALTLYDYESQSYYRTFPVPPIGHNVTPGSNTLFLGEATIAAPAGTVQFHSAGANASYYVVTRAVKVELPYVRLGVGLP